MKEMLRPTCAGWDGTRPASPFSFFLSHANANPMNRKLIVIDPTISFGRPSIMGTGIATAIVAERYKAGESVDELAEDYGCERNNIEEAVRCELALAA